MDGVKSLKEQREELYAEYEILVKRFLFCFDLIKRDYKKERVVIEKNNREWGRTYNIEIIVALMIMDFFYKCKENGKYKLDRHDLITIWGIAFDAKCPYGRRQKKKLLIIQPKDYMSCYYPKKKERKTQFKYEFLDKNSFYKMSQYVPEDMFYDYIGKFLRGLMLEEEEGDYYLVGDECYKKSDETKEHIKFFEEAFSDFARLLREGNENRRMLESEFGYENTKNIKDGYEVMQMRVVEEGKKVAKETYERNKDKLWKEAIEIWEKYGYGPSIPDEDDIFDDRLMYEYGVWQTRMGDVRLKKKVKEQIQEILKLNPLNGITYKIQPLN